MHWLPCDHESAVVLKEWDFVASQWLPAQRPYTHAEHLYACSHAGDPSILAKDSQTEADALNPMSFSWPLAPEIAAVWPMERRRQQAASAPPRQGST